MQDSEMCEVLSRLGIVPGTPATPAAIGELESWVQLEEQDELVKTLAADREEILIEKMNDKFTEESDSESEEEKLDDTGEVESAGGGELMAPPPNSDLSGFFGPLLVEQFAQSAGNSEAGYFLRKAKMSFLAAHAAKPTRQSDIRAFVDS